MYLSTTRNTSECSCSTNEGSDVPTASSDMPVLEERIQDIAAVMDAEGVEKASLIGLSEGGLMAQLFAARHPDRVEKLVLINTTAGAQSSPLLGDYVDPGERPLDLVYFVEQFQKLVQTWGSDPSFMVEWMMPSQCDNVSFVRWVGRLQRQTASPADIKRQIDSVLNLDATECLSQIHAPTLVVHVRGDRVLHVAYGRFLADRISESTYVEVPGEDHFLWVMPNWRETYRDPHRVHCRSSTDGDNATALRCCSFH